jgi:uncharacterized protein
MVENIDQIKSVIVRFLENLKNQKIFIEKAYLYGSYAKGNATEHSDIDIALISKDFIGDRFDDRLTIAPAIIRTDSRLEPLPYRPEDFKTNDPLVVEILSTGIELKV